MQALSSEITELREQFHSQIRARSTKAHMAAIRQEYLKAEQSQALNAIVQECQTRISGEQLQTLIGLAKMGVANAVIHLGNLFIDGVLDERVFALAGCAWLLDIPDETGYFEWLSLVLLHIGIVDREFLLYVKIKITDQFRVLNAFKCMNALCRTLKEDSVRHFYLPQFKLIEVGQLFAYALFDDGEVNREVWKFASHLFTQESEQVASSIISKYGAIQLLGLIKTGLISVSAYIRAVSVQIFNNNYSLLMRHMQEYQKPRQTELFQHLIDLCLSLAQSPKEKEKVKLELSYFFASLLRHTRTEYIIYLLTASNNFIQSMGELVQWIRKSPEASENCSIICSIMTKQTQQIQDRPERQRIFNLLALNGIESYQQLQETM